MTEQDLLKDCLRRLQQSGVAYQPPHEFNAMTAGRVFLICEPSVAASDLRAPHQSGSSESIVSNSHRISPVA
jgi:hypothetical protein